MANGLLNYYNQNGLLQDPSANIARQMTPQMQFQNPLLGMDLSPRQPTFGDQARTAAMGAARGLGNAFTGEGSSARLAALGASLLAGPSPTPISFGSSMAQGLLAGNIAAQQEQERKFKRGLLEREMAVAEAKLRPDPTKAKNVNVILPDGTTTYASSDELGNLTLPDGTKVPEGSQIFGTNIAASKLVDLAPADKKAFSEFEDLTLKATTLFNSGNKVLELLDKSPESATVVSGFSGLASTIYQNVEEAAKAFGVPDEKLEKYEDIFEENSVSGAKLKSMVLDLAYQAAAMRGQEGRGLSDRDVQIFSQIIGGKNLNPSQRAAVLRNYLESIKSEVSARANILSERAKRPLALPSFEIYTPEFKAPPPSGGGEGNRQDAVKAALDRANQAQQVR